MRKPGKPFTMLFYCGAGRGRSADAARHYIRELTGENRRFYSGDEPTQEIQMEGPGGIRVPVRVMVRGAIKNIGERQLKPYEVGNSHLVFGHADPELFPNFFEGQPLLSREVMKAKKDGRYYNIWEMGNPTQEEIKRIVFDSMKRHYGT